MRKSAFALCLLLLLLTGCAAQPAEEAVPKGTPAQEEETAQETADSETPSDEIEVILPQSYLLASGAGGWSTVLFLENDGTFHGEYHDSDMGVTGENYPNGTVYRCRFSGTFALQTQDDSRFMNILSLETQDIPGEITYEDGQRMIGSAAYGLDGTEKLVIYPAGFSVADLPENFYAGWAQEYLYGETELPYTVLYHEMEQLAFVEYEFS